MSSIWRDETNDEYYSSGSEQTVKNEDEDFTSANSESNLQGRVFQPADVQSRLRLPPNNCSFDHNELLSFCPPDNCRSTNDNDHNNVLATFEAATAGEAFPLVAPPLGKDLFLNMPADLKYPADLEQPPTGPPGFGESSLVCSTNLMNSMIGNMETSPEGYFEGELTMNQYSPQHGMDVDLSSFPQELDFEQPRHEILSPLRTFPDRSGFGVVPLASMLPPPVSPYQMAEQLHSRYFVEPPPLPSSSVPRISNDPNFATRDHTQINHNYFHSSDLFGTPNLNLYNNTNAANTNFPAITGATNFPFQVPLMPSGIVSAQMVPRDPQEALTHYQNLLIEKMKDDGADPQLVNAIQQQFSSRPPVQAGARSGYSSNQWMRNDDPQEEKLSCRTINSNTDQSEMLEAEAKQDQVKQVGQGEFACDVCHKKYKTEKYLRAHVKVHSPMAPACDVCGKKFATPDKLRRHHTIHTGEKPFQCEFCQRAFNRKEHLTKHRRVHTGEKPYVCPTCNRGFTQKGNLSSHLKIHTGERPFECTVCNKSFRLKSHLITHTRTHTGEKPFSCDHCSKRFSDQSSLSRHRRLHFGNKYKCPICQKEFTDVSNVRRHQRTSHGAVKFSDSPILPQ